MAEITRISPIARLSKEVDAIEADMIGSQEPTLRDLRGTQLYIARAVLYLAEAFKPKPEEPRPRWQQTALDTFVKWGTMAVILMAVYVFLQVVNSGFKLP